jgi:hypothetical protein
MLCVCIYIYIGKYAIVNISGILNSLLYLDKFVICAAWLCTYFIFVYINACFHIFSHSNMYILCTVFNVNFKGRWRIGKFENNFAVVWRKCYLTYLKYKFFWVSLTEQHILCVALFSFLTLPMFQKCTKIPAFCSLFSDNFGLPPSPPHPIISVLYSTRTTLSI